LVSLRHWLDAMHIANFMANLEQLIACSFTTSNTFLVGESKKKKKKSVKISIDDKNN
jgi:hypothetical protein